MSVFRTLLIVPVDRYDRPLVWRNGIYSSPHIHKDLHRNLNVPVQYYPTLVLKSTYVVVDVHRRRSPMGTGTRLLALYAL